ncbi:MAG: YfhO family protein [bacterium]
MGKRKKIKEIKIEEFRFSRTDLFIIVGLLVLVLIYFFKLAISKGIFITGDLTLSDLMSQYYPFRHLLGESLKNLQIPLWTQYIFGGYPILAQGEMGAFYPLNLILFSLLPDFVAFNFSVILNFFLGTLFLFLYARVINLSKSASLLSAVAFSFSGFFITQIRHINMINTAIWIPLLFFLIEYYFKKKNIIYILLAGMVFGIQILAGHFQIAYYSVLGTSLYFLFKIGQNYLLSLEKKTKSRLPLIQISKTFSIFFTKKLACLVLIFVIGGALAGIQLLPTYEFMKQGTRSQGLSFDEAVGWGYQPKHLITFVLPYFYGDYAKGTFNEENTLFWENCGYVGIIPLILALLSSGLLKTNGYVRFFAFFLVLSIALTMGKYTPIFKIFWEFIPGAQYFRFPNRFLLFVALSLSVLAGFGMDYIKNRIKIPSFCFQGSILILIIDLFVFGIGHNPAVDPKVWFSPPETVKFLAQDKDFFRICSFGNNESWRMVYSKSSGWKGNDLDLYIKHRGVLQENFNMIYHLESFFGYPPKSFGLQRCSNLYYFLLYQKMKLYGRPNEPLPFTVPEPAFSKILGIMNVKYILSFWEMNDPNLEVVMKTDFKKVIPDIKVYQNKMFLPRVYVVPKAKIVKGEGEILGELSNPGFDPRKEVIIEEEIDFRGVDTANSAVKITKYSPLEVIIEAKLTDDGFLVLGDTYYPGWEAFVDDKLTKIYQANYLQRAIPIKEGRHKIRFIYNPISFKIGAIISILTLLLTVIYLWRRLTQGIHR